MSTSATTSVRRRLRGVRRLRAVRRLPGVHVPRVRRLGLPAVALVPLLVWCAAPGPAAAATAPSPPAVPFVGPVREIYRTTADRTASFPSASAFDVPDGAGRLRRTVLVGFSTGDDVPTATSPPYAVLTSTDGGRSFPTSRLRPLVVQAVNLTALPDGRLVDVRPVGGRVVAWSGQPAADVRRYVRLRVNRSGDHGATWSRVTAPCSRPDIGDEACLHLRTALLAGRGVDVQEGITPFVDTAGATTLLAPYYGRFAGDLPGSSRAEVARSTDGGATWSTQGTIARPKAFGSTGWDTSYTEVSMTRLPDGRLYAVLRSDLRDEAGNAGGALPLTWSVSSDGRVWSPPVRLQVQAADGSLTTWRGVAPVVRLLPNGVFLLSAGRLDNWVAMADTRNADGTPHWRRKQLVYANYPTAGTAYRARGSSGYTGLVGVSSNRALLVADNCAPAPWGCPPDSLGFIHGKTHRLVGAYVDVPTPDSGKLDLAGGLRSGRVRLTQNSFTWSAAGHGETRPSGAFDGSTDYWSSAMAAHVATTASMTLQLDRAQWLTRVGLSLHRDIAASAEVLFSVDGTHWTAQGAGFTTRLSRSLAYANLSPRVRARYVRVVVRPSAHCRPDIGAGCASLNELELYSATVRSFENDAVGGRPRDYATPRGAWVTQLADDSRALRVRDMSNTTSASATGGLGPAGAHRTLEFRIMAVRLGANVQCVLNGTTGAGRPAGIYRVAVSPSGGLRLFTRGAWQSVDVAGTRGLFALGSWHRIRLVASRGGAAVIVDGVRRATLLPPPIGVRSLSTHTFASAGNAGTGEMLLDDISNE